MESLLLEGALLKTSKKEIRVSFFSLGCRLNQSESASLASGFLSEGFCVVEEEAPADIHVINTCSVTHEAETKCRGLIRRLLKKRPETFIAVTGCYAQAGLHALQQVPGIDLIVGTDHKMDLPLLIQQAWGGERPLKRSAPLVIHTQKINRGDFTIPSYAAFDHATRPNIKIQDGCDFFCSFCIIPYTRGRERSRQFNDILMEASLWAARGHREVVLTGVNLGEYRSDGKGLSDVIAALEKIEGLSRIRISSIEPTTVSDDLLDQMSRAKKLCPYLHLPVQSGNNAVLSAMGRRYTREEYMRFVAKAAERVPALGLGTDVMVGFPGEDDDAFGETVSLVSTLPFSYLHVFPFSERKGTRVTRMDLPPVPPQVIKKRVGILSEISKKCREAFYQNAVGQTVRVLFEAKDDRGYFCGYTPNYIRVGVKSAREIAGFILPVTVQHVEGGLAIGVVEEIP